MDYEFDYSRIKEDLRYVPRLGIKLFYYKKKSEFYKSYYTSVFFFKLNSAILKPFSVPTPRFFARINAPNNETETKYWFF